VKYAEPDIDTVLDEYALALPNDDLLGHEWHLENRGRLPDVTFPIKYGADAKVVDAWRRLGNLGSSDIVVAVIDNGFDLTHPDLKSKVYRPFDLWNNSPRLNQGDPRFSHGTPCASVAVAAANGSGIVGAAPNAKFMPVSGTSFSLRATEQMFEYCVKNGADVISCSWGTTDPQYDLSPLKEQAIARAAREGRNGKGCVILFAVGNDDLDYVNFYADHPDVIAVAATDSQDRHASYSNRGRQVTVCAPSNGSWPITAARAWWDEGLSWETGNYRYWRDGRSRGDRYKHFGGTSSSTPLVAGICALILSANPNLTAKEVKEILIKTADKVGSPSEYSNGHSVKYGYGRVNADKAVAEALRRRESTVAPVEMEDTVSTGQGLFRFSVQKQANQGWGVQVGVYGDYGNVLVAAEELERKFNAPVVVNINELNGKTVYKVVLGAYGDVNQARTLLSRMSAAGMNGFLRNLRDLA
jgi:subtilisin family serine protease